MYIISKCGSGLQLMSLAPRIYVYTVPRLQVLKTISKCGSGLQLMSLAPRI